MLVGEVLTVLPTGEVEQELHIHLKQVGGIMLQ